MAQKEAPPGRQTRKRLATRQRISDAATHLMLERGFDAVTVDEIAEAADVSRMTVFNHFPRKEDMFFDLDDEGREAIVACLHERPEGTSPLEALRRFPHQAIVENRPYAQFAAPGSDHFTSTVRASEALKARARAIRDELTDTLAAALTRTTAQPAADPLAHLAASLVLSTWTAALMEAQAHYARHHSSAAAHAIFFELNDRGFRGVEAALAGTPYAS